VILQTGIPVVGVEVSLQALCCAVIITETLIKENRCTVKLQMYCGMHRQSSKKLQSKEESEGMFYQCVVEANGCR
jgi:hypothetical protein